jgi:hypothetical protein
MVMILAAVPAVRMAQMTASVHQVRPAMQTEHMTVQVKARVSPPHSYVSNVSLLHGSLVNKHGNHPATARLQIFQGSTRSLDGNIYQQTATWYWAI